MAKPRKAASGTSKTDDTVEVKKAKTDKSQETAAAAATGTDRSRVKFESTLTRLEAAAYFEAIVSGLRKGALKFKQGEDAISLAPAEHVEVEVKAQRKKGKENVSFEISWHTSDNADLSISTK